MEPNTRLAVFLIGCIGFRSALALRARYASDIELTVFAVIAAITAIAFAGLYLFDLRKEAPEAGGQMWWGNYRPIHSTAYGLAAYFAMKGDRTMTSNILFIDVAIGLIARILHR